MKAVKSLSLVVLVALFGGCATENALPRDPEDRLTAVRGMTRASEDRAVGLLPARAVERVRQLEEGTILRCGGGYLWSGNVRVQLRPGVNAAAARDRLARAAAKHDFAVDADELLSGGARYELTDPAGVQLLVTAWGDDAIDIDSASPCFDLPRDFDVPRSF